MFCPRCGKQVDESDALCRSCGHTLSTNKPPPSEARAAANAATPEESRANRKRSRQATASLILALFSLIPVPGFLIKRAWSINASLDWFYLGHGVYYRALMYMFAILRYLEMPLRGGLLPLLAGAGLVGVIIGHRAYTSTPRIGGRFLGKGKATLGLVLGYPAVAGWFVYGIVNFVVVPYALTPMLERETIRSNELSARDALRSIESAVEVYASKYEPGYPPSLAVLGPPKGIDPNLPWDERYKLENAKANANAANMITEEMASGTYSGYRLTYAPGKKIGTRIVTFTAHADPLIPGKTGNRHYFIDESGVLRFASRTQADADCPPIAD